MSERIARLPTVYTVGHSNRSIEYLLKILRAVEVRQLVDVRAYPTSAKHPQFARECLQRALADSGITYFWAGSRLGGMRKGHPTSPHRAIASSSLRAYADYMETHEFRNAIDGLIDSAKATRTVLLCAERDPLQCHRSLIADCLTYRDIQVRHLIDDRESWLHQLNSLARLTGDHLVYDRGTTCKLDLEQ